MDDGHVVFAHVAHDVEFGLSITFHRAEMVEMFLEDVEQHTHTGTVVHIFQLMRRKLINHNAFRLDVLHHIETRNADVTRKDGIVTRRFQQMIDEARCGAFALGSRDADGLLVELAEEQVCLGGDLHPSRVEILQGNPRCLDDDVVVVHGLKITIAKVFHAFHLVLVGHSDIGIGQVFVQEMQGRFPLATKAEDEDAFAA